MVKRVFVFSLPEGSDPDEFWKFWEEVHAAEFKKFPALRKYIIHRVTKVVKGEQKFWGLGEVWYDSEEAYNQAREGSPVVERVSSDGYSERVIDEFSAWVEEKVIM